MTEREKTSTGGMDDGESCSFSARGEEYGAF